MRSRIFPWSSRLIGIALFLLAGGVFAQTESAAIKDASDIVFNEGVELASKQRYAEAAERFQKAITLRDTLGARIELAKCFEELGKVASALAQWQRVYTEASKDADNPKAQRRKKLAAEAIPRLEIRLSGIILEVPEGLPTMAGFTIQLDQDPVAAIRWGQRIAADVGDHQLEVMALDQVPWRRTVTIRAEKESVRIRIEPDWSNVGHPGFHAVPSTARALRIAGGIGIGLGIAGVGTSGIFGGLAISRNDASNDGHCNAQDRCDHTGYQLRKDALSFASLSTATAIVGGLSLATGIVLVAVAPTKPTAKQGLRTRFWVGPSGFVVQGMW